MSRMTRLLNVAIEGQLACILLHEVFEALECDNFPECDVNSFSSRLHPKDLGRLVSQPGIGCFSVSLDSEAT